VSQAKSLRHITNRKWSVKNPSWENISDTHSHPREQGKKAAWKEKPDHRLFEGKAVKTLLGRGCEKQGYGATGLAVEKKILGGIGGKASLSGKRMPERENKSRCRTGRLRIDYHSL